MKFPNSICQDMERTSEDALMKNFVCEKFIWRKGRRNRKRNRCQRVSYFCCMDSPI